MRDASSFRFSNKNQDNLCVCFFFTNLCILFDLELLSNSVYTLKLYDKFIFKNFRFCIIDKVRVYLMKYSFF